MIPLPPLSGRVWAFLGALLVFALVGVWIARLDALRASYAAKWKAEQVAHTQTVENYRAAAAQRKASDLQNVQRVGTEAVTIDKDTLDDYQKRLAALRADFAERVRRATAANSGSASGAHLPGVSLAAAGTDEAARQAQFPAQDALIASEQAEQLIALQAWNRRVAAIDVNGKP